MKIYGTVTAGEKEGAFYVEKYMEQLTRFLGKEPFLGTLNLKVGGEEYRKFIAGAATIKGPRGLHDIMCLKIRVNDNVDAAVVLPKKRHYEYGTMEIIASDNLREKLGLKDGDEVWVTR